MSDITHKPPPAERHQVIAEMMARPPSDPEAWRGTKSRFALARLWGVHPTTVARDAAEVSRALGSAYAPERLAEVASHALEALEGALLSPETCTADRVRAADVALRAHASAPFAKLAGAMANASAFAEEWPELRALLLDALRPCARCTGAVVNVLTSHAERKAGR